MNYYEGKKQYAGVEIDEGIPWNSMLKEDLSGLVSNIKQRSEIKECKSDCVIRA